MDVVRQKKLFPLAEQPYLQPTPPQALYFLVAISRKNSPERPSPICL